MSSTQEQRAADFERLMNFYRSDAEHFTDAAATALYELGVKHGQEEMQNAGYRLRTRRPLSDEQKAYAQLDEEEPACL